MRRRCYYPNDRQFKDYGGRGITVCQRWQNYQNFESDMLPTYQPGLTLDRINNDGNYEPENCKWSTRKEQQRNQRTTQYVEIEGKSYKAIELAEISGLKADTIVARAKRGLPYKSVISQQRQFHEDLQDHIKRAVAARVEKQKEATHCRNEHKITQENTRYTKQGWRVCRVCRRIDAAKRRKDKV